MIRHQLNGSGQVSPNSVGIFQVAQNPLKFATLTFFVWNNVRVFFSRRQKIWPKLRENHPPLCPSPNNVGYQSSRAKTLCVCFHYCRGGGGIDRRVDSQERVWSLIVSPVVKKEHGTVLFLTEKELAWQISVNSDQFGKSLWFCHWGQLPRTLSVVCNIIQFVWNYLIYLIILN